MTALRKSDQTLTWVQRTFGHAFLRPDLCYAALTHRSVGTVHNERLEYLGDSILNCAVARLLFDAYPQADEGALSRLRATLVSGKALAEMAADIGLGDHLRLGSGELKTGGFRRASILADALEAVLGAISLDAGFDAAAAAVAGLMATRLAHLPAAESLKDPKTRLQEALQAQGLPLPTYTLTKVDGEAHAQNFAVTCEVAAWNVSAPGEGVSRRGAEQLAATRLLELLPRVGVDLS